MTHSEPPGLPHGAAQQYPRVAGLLLVALVLLAGLASAACIGVAIARPTALRLLAGAIVGSFELPLQIGLAFSALLWAFILSVARRLARPRLRRPGIAAILILVLTSGAIATYERASYSRDRVTYQVDDAAIVATYYRPRGAGPYPAIILGSGAANLRREFMHLYADHLARLGFVVLNPDKRGVGESTGLLPPDTGFGSVSRILNVRARDFAAAARFLRARDGVRSDAIGFFGVSQGPWAAPLIADQALLRFMVLISVPVVTENEERVFGVLTGEEHDHFGYTAPHIPFDSIDRIMDTVTKSGFDIVPYFRRSSTPSLFVFGGWDKSVPAARSAAAVREMARDGAPFALFFVPDANHGLMITRGPRKRFLTYFAPEFWPAIDGWLTARVPTVGL